MEQENSDIVITYLEEKKPLLAIEFLQGILQKNPDDIDGLMLLGKAYLAASKPADAKTTFEKLIALSPDNAECLFYLGRFAEQRGDFRYAESYYRKSIDNDPSKKQTHMQLANILHRQNQHYDAFKALRYAETYFKDSHEFKYARGHIASTIAPTWHLPMLADTERNDLYEEAINISVQPGDIVLDIGAGSGLLSLMAARAGAAHVYACESNPVLADIAREIVQANGYADKITVINKHSTEIALGKDMPAKADILVTEIFDNAFVGEGALPTLQHARENLLKPDVRIIPQRASIKGQLFASAYLRSFHKAGMVNGFDVSAMNILSHELSYKDADINFSGERQNQLLSDIFLLFDYDFTAVQSERFETVSQANILQSGEVDTVLIWFELHFPHGKQFTTQNVGIHQHWRQVYQSLTKPYQCQVGDVLHIKTIFDRFFEFQLSRAG